MKPTYLVTTFLNGKSRSRIWQGKEPLQLDFDPSWQLVQQGADIRAEARWGKDKKPFLITEALIASGSKIRLDKISAGFQVREIRTLTPAFAQRRNGTQSGHWMVYHSLKEMVLSAGLLNQLYEAAVGDQNPLKLVQRSGQVTAYARVDSVELVDSTGKRKRHYLKVKK